MMWMISIWGLVSSLMLCHSVRGLPEKYNGGCPPPPETPRHVTWRVERGGGRVVWECAGGRWPVGDTTARCVGGDWDRRPPVCVGGGCRPLEGVAGATTVLQLGGAVVRYQCEPGLVRTGPGVLVCDGREWNGTIPTCSKDSPPKVLAPVGRRSHQDWLGEADYTCVGGAGGRGSVRPPTLPRARPNPQWRLVDGLPRLYATYRCYWGYRLASPTARLYCSHRKWVGPQPKCEPAVPTPRPVWAGHHGDQPSQWGWRSHDDWLAVADYTCLGNVGDRTPVPPPTVDQAAVSLRYALLRDGLPHLYSIYSCRQGYRLSNQKQKYMYCQKKDWQGIKPTCIKADGGAVRGCAGGGGCSHICREERGAAVCDCRQGFVLLPDRRRCADEDECLRGNGGCSHECINTEGSFRCTCPHTYSLADDLRTCKWVPRDNRSRHRPRDMKPPMTIFQ